MDTKNKQHVTTRSSLAVRLILPTVFVVLLTLSLVGALSYKISEQLYNYQTVDTLKNNLQLSYGALEDGWQHTSGATLRTEESLRSYTGTIMEGRLNLLGFPKNSGVMLIDSYTGTILHTYPTSQAHLNIDTVKRLLQKTASEMHVEPLITGGFSATYAFAPLGIHFIAFNQTPFEQTQTAPLLRLSMIISLGLTLLFLSIFMLVMLRYSIIRPLRSMNRRINDILQEDDFHHRMPTHAGAKELQEMTEQFNILLSHIDKRDHDLTEHNERLEELVEQRTQELQNAQEKIVLQERLAAIGEFASSVAHELRNPLSSIKMGVEKIHDIDSITGNDRRRLELIQKEVDRLNDMLKGILSFAAPTPMQLSLFNIQHTFDDLDPTLKDICRQEGVFLEMPEEIPSSEIKADSHKLKQALINCIKNAAEAAPKKSSVIVSIDIGESHALVHIRNQGDPIPSEALNRLFEPFFTTKSEGTGLGLPTTKRLMQEMNGDIYVKSDAKSGTVCTLKLTTQPT